MFQKSFAADAENKVSGKDRKKLRASLQRLYPRLTDDQLEAVFPLKEGECTVARLKAPHRGHIYLLDSLPLLLELSKKDSIVPCLPVLWKCPKLLPVLTVKHHSVSKFIMGGADLMLPGTQLPFEDGFLRGTWVAVCVPGNPCPFAIGRGAMSSIEAAGNAEGKGKVVEVVHCYGDKMVAHFSHMQPPNVGFTSDCILPIDLTGPPVPSEAPSSSVSVEEEVTEEQPEPISENFSLEEPLVDMDELLRQCFLQALYKSVKDSDLPLPAGELWINHMLPNKQPGVNVDVKQSSFKKLSKFLQIFATGDAPLLTLKVEKYSNETVITAIDRDHDAYTTFRPYSSHAAQPLQIPPSPGLQIEEVYRMGRELTSVLTAIGLEPGCVLTKKDTQEMPFRYVQSAGLDQGVPDKAHVVLDKVLGEALFKGLLKKDEKIPEYWPKAQLKEAAMKRMHRQFRVSRGAQTILKKGTLPAVQIRHAKRSGNKFETRALGLETFLIDVTALAGEVQKRFACSASLQSAFHKGMKLQELVIQGKQGPQVMALLKEEYGIPDVYLQL